MTPHQLTILAYLDRKADAQATATTIMRDCGLSHDDAYSALIGLEAAGAVEVLTDYTDDRRCSGKRYWHLTPTGARMLALPAPSETDRLTAICVAAHDGILRGMDDNELLALLETAWKQTA